VLQQGGLINADLFTKSVQLRFLLRFVVGKIKESITFKEYLLKIIKTSEINTVQTKILCMILNFNVLQRTLSAGELIRNNQ
jgi:hypothetical protein